MPNIYSERAEETEETSLPLPLPLPLPPPTPPPLTTSRGPEYTEALQSCRTSKLELSAKAINGSECSSTVISKGITNNA